jgi:hypothetical protein
MIVDLLWHQTVAIGMAVAMAVSMLLVLLLLQACQPGTLGGL